MVSYVSLKSHSIIGCSKVLKCLDGFLLVLLTSFLVIESLEYLEIHWYEERRKTSSFTHSQPKSGLSVRQVSLSPYKILAFGICHP